MNTTVTATPAAFKLTPPEVVTPLEVEQTKGADLVEVPSELKSKVLAQAQTFLAGLLQDDVTSDSFKDKLDKAFAVGRKEISDAATLSNGFLDANFSSEIDTPAYKAISQMRNLFDDLNPAKEGDLLGARKLFNIIPFGNKLKGYLRRYQSAQTQLNAISEHLQSAQDEVSKSVVKLGMVQTDLWNSLQKLQAVIEFIKTVDNELENQIERLKASEPMRAKALEQEVLYYFRQNLGDVQACMALTINAYNVAGELKKTGRETINGCNRMNTLGRAALSVAVTMARATGIQVQTMKMLTESKKTVEDLILATSDQLVDHTKAVAEFSSNPVAGVQTLTAMFDKTFEAMDTYDKFRTNALTVMKTNYEMLAPRIANELERISANKKAADEGIAL